MTGPLRVGIVGCGVISLRYLLNAARFAPIRIVACADLDPAAARDRAAQFSTRASSVDALLGAGDVDVVVNLTPPHVHFDLSLAALTAGKHVFSEKPLADSVTGARRLVEEAGARGLRLGCAPDTFLGGAGQSARALVDSGRIGRIVGGTCHVMGRGPEAWHPNPDFFFLPGGGPVLDVGPYHVTYLVNLLGPVRRVSAAATAAFDRRTIGSGPRTGEVVPVQTPTTVHALLEFDGGSVVTLGASFDVWRHTHASIEIYGTDGSMTLPDPNFFGGDPRITRAAGPFTAESSAAHPFSLPNREVSAGRHVADYRMLGVAEMADAIVAARPHRCAGDLALHVLDVLESTLQAAIERRTLELGSTCERPAPLGPGEAARLLRQA